MSSVAVKRVRDLQILGLRALAVQQTHRVALVSYLRDYGIRGAARDQTLREFYGVLDPSEAAIMEHRHYLLAASTRICAIDLLELVGDTNGVQLLRSYESAYGSYFGMFCERARAARNGTHYLLESLLPEVLETTQRLRARALAARLPPRRAFMRGRGALRPSL